LPGPEFTYGRSDHGTISDGVGNLVNHWKVSKPSVSKQDKCVDFKKINRAVVTKRGQTSTRVSYQKPFSFFVSILFDFILCFLPLLINFIPPG